MATVHFSVPDSVRDRFNEVFEGQNTGEIMATFMIRAIEDEERRRRPPSLVERLRQVGGPGRLVGKLDIGRALEELRE